MDLCWYAPPGGRDYRIVSRRCSARRNANATPKAFLSRRRLRHCDASGRVFLEELERAAERDARVGRAVARALVAIEPVARAFVHVDRSARIGARDFLDVGHRDRVVLIAE